MYGRYTVICDCAYFSFFKIQELPLLLTLRDIYNQSTDSTEGQEIEDTRQHKRSDKVT